MTEPTREQREYKLHTHIVKKHAIHFADVGITHVPNRPSSGKDGFFKREMGVRKGVSDLCLWWAYPYPAWAMIILAWIERILGFTFATMHNGVVEIKVDADVDTEQNKFLSFIHSMGGRQGVVRSWRQYYHLLCSWKIKPTQECRVFEEPDYRSAIEQDRAEKSAGVSFFAPPKAAPEDTK